MPPPPTGDSYSSMPTRSPLALSVLAAPPSCCGSLSWSLFCKVITRLRSWQCLIYILKTVLPVTKLHPPPITPSLQYLSSVWINFIIGVLGFPQAIHQVFEIFSPSLFYRFPICQHLSILIRSIVYFSCWGNFLQFVICVSYDLHTYHSVTSLKSLFTTFFTSEEALQG